MIVRALAMVAMVAAPSTFAVGYWQGQTMEPDTELSTVQVNAPNIAKPGNGAATAARSLAEFNAPPPPPPPPPVPSVVSSSPPGPPPIDVGVQFRRDVTAVLTGTDPHVVLAGGRKLAKGQIYSDGWKVRDLTAQSAVLSKGRETRNINLFSAPARDNTVQLASVSPVFTGPISLSNGLPPMPLTPEQARQFERMPPEARGALMQAFSAGGGARPQGGNGGRGGGEGGGGRGRRGGGDEGPNGGFGGFRRGENQPAVQAPIRAP